MILTASTQTFHHPPFFVPLFHLHTAIPDESGQLVSYHHPPASDLRVVPASPRPLLIYVGTLGNRSKQKTSIVGSGGKGRTCKTFHVGSNSQTETLFEERVRDLDPLILEDERANTYNPRFTHLGRAPSFRQVDHTTQTDETPRPSLVLKFLTGAE